jgi:hypothetical protein
MTTMVQPICMMCKHFRREEPGLRCDAFPDGIPDDIFYSRADHTKPMDDDSGIRFEQDPKMPTMDYEFYKTLFTASTVAN